VAALATLAMVRRHAMPPWPERERDSPLEPGARRFYQSDLGRSRYRNRPE